MARKVIHAPDGGIVGHSLCEEPTGDVTDYERDVDCGDCLDDLERADGGLRDRMRQHGFEFLADNGLTYDQTAKVSPAVIGTDFPTRPGYVTGECGHAVAGSEWRAGYRKCERC